LFKIGLKSNRRWAAGLVCALCAVVGFGVTGCPGKNNNNGGNTGVNSGGGSAVVPAPNSPDYPKAVTAFFVSLAAVELGDEDHAGPSLDSFVTLAPGEPAAWANRAVYELRKNKIDEAAKDIAKAEDLAPDSGQIKRLHALLEGKRGDFAREIEYLQKAIQLDPNSMKSLFSLSEELERQGGPNSDKDAQEQLVKLVEKRPSNIVAKLQLARLAAKQGDAQTLNNAIQELDKRSAGWSSKIAAKFKDLKAAAAGANVRPAAIQVALLTNVFKENPQYSIDYSELKAPAEQIGEPLRKPLKMQAPPPTPSAPDESLTFTAEPLPISSTDKTSFARDVILMPELPLDVAREFGMPTTPASPPGALAPFGNSIQVLSGEGKKVELMFPGGSAHSAPSPAGIATLDWNYDFKNDIAMAGAGGLLLYQQAKDGTFSNVTARSHLPASVASAALYGVWPVDFDLDGDLDLVVAPISGPPVVLSNDGNGNFKVVQPFNGVSNVRQFAWLDIDGDGVGDAAFVDATGKLQLFANERSGRFHERALPAGFDKIAAITVADANNDGKLDIVALKTDGTLVRLSDKAEGTDWDTAEIGKWDAPPAGLSVESARLLVGDLDNNGGNDYIASAGSITQVWLSDVQGALKPLSKPIEDAVYSVADMNGDGRLDLIGVSPSGRPVRLINKGMKNYHWQFLQPRSTHTTDGDKRINTFGIGGELEVRAGFLVQKQPITGSLVHFGLGENPTTNVVRITWPNGTAQAEFDIQADQTALAKQRLKGSCPWLFAWNGKSMEFVTDFIWRSPLGLKINAQDTAGVAMTEDWVKIRGDQLAPKDGAYDLRISAELWETHFFDYVSLMTVDHPAGTEIYVDERFAFPSPPLKVFMTTPARPIKRAVDDRGQDVTEIVSKRDGNYLDTFGRGEYQGVTRDHYVEVELNDEPSQKGPLYLLAYGWIHPTDSSINVALSQGNHVKPRAISLEVPDGDGKWVIAKPNLGFPEGKSKTILIPLDGVFKPGAPRKLRLRTNLEIYWDLIQVANELTSATIKTQRLEPQIAELRYRGYSVMNQPNESSPELPDYNRIASTMPQWRDLIGYCTRFGDVRELLKKVDDRYVIMNAGDEMAFRFAAPPPPPAGWVRDFVMIGDGWEKDGDFNTGFSKTVLPLPSHNNPKYNTPPGRLEDDPVYRRYPQDWQTYHTRYITPDYFRNALRQKVSE
jgi:tetratricopeptide (TPR) repeat protein